MEQIEDHSQVTEIENGTGISQGNPSIQQNSSQGIQGQSVIQTNQQSVIQSPPSTVHPSIQNSLQAQLQLNQQAVQVQAVPEGTDENAIDEDSKKRRDILSRRPSYRKIFNDLSSSDSPSKIETIQEDSLEASDQNISAISTTAITYQQGSQTVTIPGTIQIVTSGGEAVQGLQAMPISAGSGGAQATVVQYQAQQDGQQYIYTATPGEVQVSNTGTMYTIPAGQQQYIRAGQLQQGLVLNSSGMSPNNQQVVAEEATRKREMRLMKNREAAKECRRKKKEYVKCLENRVAVLENQNKTLIEELKALKDLYCHKSE
ncbi:cAMP-responsive element modulator isoform X2 [Exaiptasia diaphana]|uniref:Uncharacterized protein n=1 Tax=Exaiptasia diaphana TaxID=2652724 RepID=A0A913WRV3_EXADI|nr:cAMP-responsive element modulator isoform X2 [Exaiptasia diaphana]